MIRYGSPVIDTKREAGKCRLLISTGGADGIRPALRRRPPRGSDVLVTLPRSGKLARHSLPLGVRIPLNEQTK